MALLLRMKGELEALQNRAREIARSGRELVSRQVAIQKKTAEEQMLAREMPSLLEAAENSNPLKEREIVERARHLTARFAAAASGTIIGTIGGLYAGIERSVSTLVKEHPKVAIPLGIGLGAFTLQLVSYPGLGLPPFGLFQAFVLKSALAAGVTAVATGIGSGLMARVSRNAEEETSLVKQLPK